MTRPTKTKPMRLYQIFSCSIFFALLFVSVTANGQCNRPYIKIDGNRVLADNSQTQNGLVLPLWLKSGQTLEIDQNVISISVIEFDVADQNLQFSQVLSITSELAVPADKVWKVESIVKGLIYNTKSQLEIVSGGSFVWTVPECVSHICVEIWGGGGGGGGGQGVGVAGGGGGAGAYGYECFDVVGGSTHTITLGLGGNSGGNNLVGGNGGSSSVGTLISAGGGAGGLNGTGGGTGGAGGTSTAYYNIPGPPGSVRISSTGGSGGGSPNGGIGGRGVPELPGGNGESPGAGGAGGGGNSVGGTTRNGGSGADGKILITW